MLRLILVAVVVFTTSCGDRRVDSKLDSTNTLMFSGPVPEGGWKNPYYTNDSDIYEARKRGLQHALVYPIVDHAAVMPFSVADGAMKTFARIPFMARILRKTGLAKFGTSWDEMFSELGLEKFPDNSPRSGPFMIPPISREIRGTAMGVTHGYTKEGVKVFTYSCAACHVRSLFGQPIIGLNSLKSRAYEYVNYAKSVSRLLPKTLVYIQPGLTRAEKKELVDTKTALKWVYSPSPKAPSLDTSIAAVSASLDLRAKDEFASRKRTRAAGKNLKQIKKQGFDSKPGTWWLFKYKNRFLSDGSVQGNPIITNILWNEIGRGGDIKGLGNWFKNNRKTIEDLTTAVMETEAPSWFDFFPKEFDLELAKQGEKHFNRVCSTCHGQYKKDWHNKKSKSLSMAELTKTVAVEYHDDTPTLDVGTDPVRAEGIKFLAAGLNNLTLSKTHGAKTTFTGGYVPQPLVGIWARWPYFHNNSAANLCEVLTPASERLKTFYIRPADRKERDYDAECVGAPFPADMQARDREEKYLFDTRKLGLSNSGHDEGVFLENGRPRLSQKEKRAVIEYLKTL